MMALPEELASLVTDRTVEDILRLKELKARMLAGGVGALTETEKAEYLAGMKGAYNYTDLNRVGEAVQFVADTLIEIADDLETYREERNIGDDPLFDVIDTSLLNVDTKTDWSMTDVPTKAQMQTYIGNVLNLCMAILLPDDAPTPPSTASNLTWELANAIEQLLIIIYETAKEIETEQYVLIDGTYEAQMYSGEALAISGGY